MPSSLDSNYPLLRFCLSFLSHHRALTCMNSEMSTKTELKVFSISLLVLKLIHFFHCIKYNPPTWMPSLFIKQRKLYQISQYPCTGIELIFFIAAHTGIMVLCFGFVTTTALITHWCFSYYWTLLTQYQGLLHISLCHSPPANRWAMDEKQRESTWDSWPKPTEGIFRTM